MNPAAELFLAQIKVLEKVTSDLQAIDFTLRSFAKIDKDIQAALVHVNESMDTAKSARTRITMAVDRRIGS